MYSLLALALIAAPAQDGAPPPPAPPPRGNPMLRADGNGDGVVTRAEATAESAQRFAGLDTDGDGKLTPAELQARLERLAAHGPARDGAPRGGLFAQRMDLNGDGTVTAKEFEAQELIRFDRNDTNGDGRLAADELRVRPHQPRPQSGPQSGAQPRAQSRPPS